MKNVSAIHRQKMPKKIKFIPSISSKTRKAVYLEASKYISDLTKLIFGGVILTNILNLNIDKAITFTIGLLAVIIFICLSLILFLKGKE
ncbi:DUF6722 family protein [Parabacteroides sp.]